MTAALRRAAALARETRPGRIGVIDIGSNSLRLVVFDRLSRAPLPVFNEKALPGLGRGLERTGMLDSAAKEEALRSIRRFVTMAEAMGVESLDLIATAAIRDAADGRDFAIAIERRSGRRVRILSGEEEARLSALGVIAGQPLADGLMGDLGGGSLELVLLDHGRLEGHQATLPLGALRLAERTGGDPARARDIIDEHLDRLPWLASVKGRAFHPVGGTWRNLARLHMIQSGYPLHIIQDYRLSRRQAEDLAGLVAGLRPRSLATLAGISRRRGEALPFGALVLERVLRAAKPAAVHFSAYGLREGVLLDSLDPAARSADPLLVGCSDIAGANGRFDSGAEHFAAWLAPLFADADGTQERLVRAACLIADIAWREHPDYRAEHAFLRVLRLPVAAVSHAERVILALALAIRYGGEAETSYVAPLARLLAEGDGDFARRLGTGLRLAYALSGGAAPLLDLTRIESLRGRIVLSLLGDGSGLFGETIQRRLEALGRAFGQPVRVVGI